MIHYRISYSNPQSRFLEIECQIINLQTSALNLHLPAWRPGRYELQNYAKNIFDFSVFDNHQNALPCRKINRNTWQVQTQNVSEVIVKYRYYAFQLDAGGSYLDDTLVYINPINCLMYAENRLDEPCGLELAVPENYQIACGLSKKSKNILWAENYHHLVDSPLIASSSLEHKTYEVAQTLFHVWLQGDWQPDWEVVLKDFEKFTAWQIQLFGEFPEKEYHFLFLILPYRFYHGVEHRNSTLICLGSAEKMNDEESYDSFLGIASHELFHSWNVCKIRPIEMMPYNYHTETYFETGWIAEGITTYYGDVALQRSGVWESDYFLAEINKTLKSHFENFGRLQASLAQASFDLWVDGYTKDEIYPQRNPSIYRKGALVAMLLDWTIRLHTRNKASLDNVMQAMWQQFGKTAKGYTMQDFQKTAEQIAQCSLQSFFDRYIFGKESLDKPLQELSEHFALNLIVQHYNFGSEVFGFKTIQKNGATLVSLIEPNSNASAVLSLADEIIAVDDRKVENNLSELLGNKQTVILTIFRQKRLLHVVLQANRESYLQNYLLQVNPSASSEQKANLVAWLEGKIL
ncbi:MAG: M61 family peptidase [Raineya sp.]|nr:M61 family peptidase [Raineya sp.]MDW8295300.1 M61 family peptidase [Raineya sp.]